MFSRLAHWVCGELGILPAAGQLCYHHLIHSFSTNRITGPSHTPQQCHAPLEHRVEQVVLIQQQLYDNNNKQQQK